MSPSDALARGTLKDGRSKERPVRFDIISSFSWRSYVSRAAFEGWAVIPIVPNGFFPKLNESFSIEVGGGLQTDFYDRLVPRNNEPFNREIHTGYGLRTLGGVRWDWYLTDLWQVWVSTKVGLHFDLSDDNPDYIYDTESLFQTQVALGGYFHFSEEVGLRLEVSSHLPIGAGLTFAF